MRKVVFVILVVLSACQVQKPELTAIMKEQQSAWNEGNVEGFMKHYWQSDSLVFIGSRGMTYGWQNTLDNYKKSYPTPELMGELDFTNLNHSQTSSKSFFTTGNWTLFRTQDTLSGSFLLVWQLKNNRWVITADHSS